MPTPGGSTTPVTLWVASGSALGSWELGTHSCIAYRCVTIRTPVSICPPTWFTGTPSLPSYGTVYGFP